LGSKTSAREGRAMVGAPKTEIVYAVPYIFLCHVKTVNHCGPQFFQLTQRPYDGGHGLYDLCSVPKAPSLFLCHVVTVKHCDPQFFQLTQRPYDGGHGLYDLCSVPKAPQGSPRLRGEGRFGDWCVALERIPRIPPPRQLAGARCRPSQGRVEAVGVEACNKRCSVRNPKR
jgi:hypothetical protein